MSRAVIFGGTTEGRKLCEISAEAAVPVTYYVATRDGARPIEALPNIAVRVGRLDAVQMETLLLRAEKPALVIDATHLYAEEATRNIYSACQNAGIPLLRVLRESTEEPDCMSFSHTDDLLAWLIQEPGNIFVTTGVSHAGVFSKLPDFQSRVWMRVLPNVESLRTCLDLGYRPERLICMQGPFSQEMNRAMFKAANARILVTKNSGAAGGFAEKMRAAQSLGMQLAVLQKPNEHGGVSLDEAMKRLRELRV
jgi:precorrin-6x reductase